MKYSGLTSLLLCLAMNTLAQWSTLNTGITQPLTAVYVLSDDTAFAVSANSPFLGNIYRTTDGNNWNLVHSGIHNLFCVHFSSPLIGWAAGGAIGGGAIYKSIDGGLNWTLQTDTCMQIMGIHFVNDTSGWAVANNATNAHCFIYHTSDGGNSWTTQYSGIDYVRSVFFINDSTGFVAGDNGRIFKTTNGGISWNLLNTGVVFHFNSVHFIDDQHGWAAGAYVTGGVFVTNDGGNSWTAQNIPVTDPMTSIVFNDLNNGWVCGSNGIILGTTDGGNTWNQESTMVTAYLNSICSAGTSAYCTGQNGTILKRTILTTTSSNVSANMAIYPNPASDAIFIKDNFNMSAIFAIASDGKTNELNHSGGYADIRALSTGVYTLQIISEMEIKYIRFIKN